MQGIVEVEKKPWWIQPGSEWEDVIEEVMWAHLCIIQGFSDKPREEK